MGQDCWLQGNCIKGLESVHIILHHLTLYFVITTWARNSSPGLEPKLYKLLFYGNKHQQYILKTKTLGIGNKNGNFNSKPQYHHDPKLNSNTDINPNLNQHIKLIRPWQGWWTNRKSVWKRKSDFDMAIRSIGGYIKKGSKSIDAIQG